jgi:hypothetical protein
LLIFFNGFLTACPLPKVKVITLTEEHEKGVTESFFLRISDVSVEINSLSERNLNRISNLEFKILLAIAFFGGDASK